MDGVPCFIEPDAFKEEEVQHEKEKPLPEKIKRLDFYLRRVPAEILLERGFNGGKTGFDIGVGKGVNENFEHLWSRVTHNLVGVDVAPGALKRFKKNFSGCTGICADACSLPFEDSSFDFATASGLVHHFVGQKVLSDLFGEVYRVLKNGGVFIFNEPNLLYPASLLMHIPNRLLQSIKPGARGRVPYERPIHFFEVRKELEKTGFVRTGFEASSFVHHRMPGWLIDLITARENSIRKRLPWKYFGRWICVYGQKGR
jgi:SAM-dependent methyltransferase